MQLPHRFLAGVVLVFVTGCTSSPRSWTSTTDLRRSPATSQIAPGHSPTVTTGSATSSLLVRDARFMCGPTDGPWISATIESSDAVRVFGQVWLDGKPYGRSEDVAVAAAGLASIGFSPDTPTTSSGRTASLRIMRSDAPTEVIADTPVLLHLPAGTGVCG